MIKIRSATLSDCRACRRLSNIPELRTPEGTAPELWWFECFIKKKQIFFVAMERTKLIGYIAGERISGNIALAHLLVVKPDKQKQGIASALSDRFEKECKKRGMSMILGYAYDKKKTLKFFKKRNFWIGSKTREIFKRLT